MTQKININDTSPGPPAGKSNFKWQADAPSSDPTVVRNASAYVPDFVASGASHVGGGVPDPGASAGTTKFLREDATWAVPAGTGGGGGGVGSPIALGSTSLGSDPALDFYASFDVNGTDSKTSTAPTNTAVTFPAGKFSNAASFNGTTSVLAYGNIINESSDHSVSFWFNLTALPASGVEWVFVIKGKEAANATNYRVSIKNNAGLYQITYREVSSLGRAHAVTFAAVISTWFHVVVSIVAGAALPTIYINGTQGKLVAIDTSASTYTSPTSTNGLFVGSNSLDTTPTFYNGLIDDLAIFSRALNAVDAEILSGGQPSAATPAQAQVALSFDSHPASPNTNNDEFEASSLNAAWTVVRNDVTSVDFSATVPGSIYCKFASATDQGYVIGKGFVPGSADFSVTLKGHLFPEKTFDSMLLVVGDTDNDLITNPGTSNANAIDWVFGGPAIIQMNKWVAGVRSTANATPAIWTPQVYLHLQRVGGTWSAWYSFDGGGSFVKFETAFTFATPTVGFVTIALRRYSAPPLPSGIKHMSIDFIRFNQIFL